MSGRRASDWLGMKPQRAEGDARGQERRGGERRAPPRIIDPLFVASLINAVAPMAARPPAYARVRAAPLGVVRDERA